MLCIALLECARPRDVLERSCGWAKLHYVSIPHDSDFTLGPILSVLYRGSDSPVVWWCQGVRLLWTALISHQVYSGGS